MKITVDNLEFNSDHFYILTDSIVEKIVFNNRTFYSKYKKYPTPISPTLLEQYHKNELTLALPLIESNHINYIVIEYSQEDWQAFHFLIKQVFKNLHIDRYMSYKNSNRNLLQIFIENKNMPLDSAYKIVEKIKQILNYKSKKIYRIFPNKNSPKSYNIITFPQNIL